MKIRKLQIKNYRNLQNVTIEFGDFTILIGKNDTGKSNILRALDLLFNDVESEDIKEIFVSPKGGDLLFQKIDIKDYRIFPDKKPTTIELVGYIEINDREIKELFPDEKFRIDGIAKQWKRSEIGKTIIITKKIKGKPRKEAILEISSINTPNISLYDRENNKQLIRKRAGEYKYVNTVTPADIEKTPSYNFINSLRKRFLKIPAIRGIKIEDTSTEKATPDGKFIPSEFLRYEKEATLGKEEIFEQINDDISKIFPDYKKVASKTEDNGKKVNVYFGKFPSSSVGSGINQFFVNIFNLNSYEDVIFGIEEPEIHLHPEAQRKVFEFLEQQAKKKQIIITTHSPIFTNCSDNIRLYLIRKDGQGIARVKKIENKDEEFKIIKYELGVRNTDLFFHDMILLVEGDTEERAIPILMECMGGDIDILGIKQINIKGKDRLGRIKEFLKYMKESDVKIFVLLDNDKGVQDYIEELSREGLINKNNYHIWSKGTFVDCFNEEYIIKAMKNIYGEKFRMKEEQLKEEREKGKSTEKILAEYLYNKSLGELNKPALGEEIALIIKQEIESGKERNETEPEEIIKKIIKIVKEKYD